MEQHYLKDGSVSKLTKWAEMIIPLRKVLDSFQTPKHNSAALKTVSHVDAMTSTRNYKHTHEILLHLDRIISRHFARSVKCIYVLEIFHREHFPFRSGDRVGDKYSSWQRKQPLHLHHQP